MSEEAKPIIKERDDGTKLSFTLVYKILHNIKLVTNLGFGIDLR